MLLSPAFLPAARAQCTADVARAAREAKEKKQKKQAEACRSQSTAKPKVYTNDEIPEAHSAGAKAGGSPAASSKTSESGTPQSSSAKNPPETDASGLPYGPDAAHIDFKFTSGTLKRPAHAETQWMLQNTSDHREHITLKAIITGPCGYHRESESAGDFHSGQSLTDNYDAELTVLSSDCAGAYRLELQAIAAGKVLASASDFVTYE